MFLEKIAYAELPQAAKRRLFSITLDPGQLWLLFKAKNTEQELFSSLCNYW